MTGPAPTKKARLKNDNKTVSLTEAETKVVKIQFQKDTTPAYAVFPRFDDLLNEYCRFLEIKLSEQATPFAPSFLIDKLWHAHILSTREYLAFCERHNRGEYLHHDPTMKRGQERYMLTLEAYQKLYGEKPSDKEIWPDRVDEIFIPGAVAGTSRQERSEEGGDIDQAGDSKEEYEYTDYEDEEDSDEDEAVQNFLEEYGDVKGRTREALAEWHKIAFMHQAEIERWDPYEMCNCYNDHQWVLGEFDLSCEGCRTSSEEMGGFSCG